MIKISSGKLCENCFAQIEREPCPVCGFSKAGYRRDPMALGVGSILAGRYAIGRVIGKGGFGVTYLAYDMKLECRVAVKEYYPYGLAAREPGSTHVSVSSAEAEETFKNGAEKFYNEARLVAKFNGNPNIVSVHDFFYENDTVYFTMGYLEGMTLKAYLKEYGALSLEKALYVAEAVSNALMAAHSMNVLHRDISPDNIMICGDGTVKLLDFGAARQVVTEGSQSLSVILKQGFAPLEQYQKKGKQGPWTDIYSLGATLYYALTLDVLDDPMSRLEEDEEYSSNKHHIVDELWQMIKKATALRIQDRYQDIFEWKKELNGLSIKPEPLVEEPVFGENGKNYGKSAGGTVYSESGREFAQDVSGDAGAQKEDVVGMTMPLREEETVGVTMPLQEEDAVGVTIPLQEEDAVGVTMPLQEEDAVDVTVKNVIMDDPLAYLDDVGISNMTENMDYKEVAKFIEEKKIQKVFGNSDLERSSIKKISFLDTKKNLRSDAWDISKARNGTVMAWTDEADEQHLYIAAEGRIVVKSARRLFCGYSNLEEIEFIDCLDTSQVEDMSGMFSGCCDLSSVDVSGFDTSQVTDMSEMFNNCSSLKSVDVSGFDTSLVTDMSWMFYMCSSLSSVDVSGFDTSRVTDMSGMFCACYGLKSVDVSGFDTSRVTNMDRMFYCCENLSSVDVSGFDTSQVTDLSCMFSYCSSLSSVDVSGFDTSQVTDKSKMFDSAGITAEEAGLPQ